MLLLAYLCSHNLCVQFLGSAVEYVFAGTNNYITLATITSCANVIANDITYVTTLVDVIKIGWIGSAAWFTNSPLLSADTTAHFGQFFSNFVRPG